MPRHNKKQYTLTPNGEFVIENYNDTKPFSSFFPGIAGPHGIPMWTFYVNRGQCVCSAGIGNKDSSMMEFLSANRAYQLVSTQGFRTFLKITRGRETEFYEPFQKHLSDLGMKRTQRMTIAANSITLEEENETLGLDFKVEFFPASEDKFPALIRELTITNRDKRPVSIEALDGISLVVPHGVDNENLKHLRHLVQFFVECVNKDKKVPFYKGIVKQEDTPDIHLITRGNFYLGFTQTQNGRPVLATPVIDPACVYGELQDFSYPERFLEKAKYTPGVQRDKNCLPCAFSHFKTTIAPQNSSTFYSMMGHCESRNALNKLIPRVANRDYITTQRELSKTLIDEITQYSFTCSSSPEFDQYCRQNFLDNSLRGGIPTTYSSPHGQDTTFHLYSRAHGDLERDYNSFQVDPTPYSQGNGAYRDINQNRRMDVLLNPKVNSNNVHHFLSLNQLDGFNPHIVMASSFTAKKSKRLSTLLKNAFCTKDTEAIRGIIFKRFSPGELTAFINENEIELRMDADLFLGSLLACCDRYEDTKFGHSFWSDHWHYNLDLIENFLYVFPERLYELMIDNNEYTYYDNANIVRPRRDKYVLWDNRPIQLGAVLLDEKKEAMILARKSRKNCVRTKHGKGSVYQTNLMAKLTTLIINKMASLDMAGVGVEMESDRPNWYDALNGLPGMFGSSISETLEIKRFIRFMMDTLRTLKLSDDFTIKTPMEIYEFMQAIHKALQKNATKRGAAVDFTYWDESATAKEAYREKIRMGISGSEVDLSVKDLKLFFRACLKKLDRAVSKARDTKRGVLNTYFRCEILDYKLIREKGANGKIQTKINEKGLPCFVPKKIRHSALPLFLEGPVHYLRVEGNTQKTRSFVKSIRKSPLFDRKLKMFKVNEDLSSQPMEIGRCRTFVRGWLENESIWLHMEYKYMLELLRGGHHDEFFHNFRNVLVPFQDPETYGRSILENSSFIASSANPDPSVHGRGFFARLSGSTAEFAHMHTLMTLGNQPFTLGRDGSICFSPRPVLPAWLFTRHKEQKTIWINGEAEEMEFAKGSFSFAYQGKTIITYINKQNKDTFGSRAVSPHRFKLMNVHSGRVDTVEAPCICGDTALAVRRGDYTHIEIILN